MKELDEDILEDACNDIIVALSKYPLEIKITDPRNISLDRRWIE